MIRVKGGVITLSYGAGGDSVNRARRDQRMFCAARYFCRTNGGGRVIRMFCPAWIRFLPRPPVGGGCLRFEKDVSASISPQPAHTPYQREGGFQLGVRGECSESTDRARTRCPCPHWYRIY